MNIPQALSFLRPEAQWALTANDYSTLEWHGPGDPPTMDELILASQKLDQKNQLINQREQLIDNGFLIQPEGFVLGLHESDRSAFAQMLSLVKEALDLGLITNETPQIIADKNGQKHQISTLRFRQIMVQYGFYYKSLWDQST